MSYLARLKAEISRKAVTVSTAITVKRAFSSFCSTDSEHISEIEGTESRAETPDKSATQTVNASSALPLPTMETAESNQYARASLESIKEDCSEFYNERAAIMEYDGGLSREDAEVAAYEATEKHRRECWERFQKRKQPDCTLPSHPIRFSP